MGEQSVVLGGYVRGEVSDFSKTNVWNWARRKTDAGVVPTLRMAARRFGVSMQTIEDVIEWEPMPYEPPFEKYLGLAVALGSSQGGVGELKRGDWIVEAY